MRVGLFSLLFKLGLKFAPALIKVLKGAKSLKIVLAAASFGLWELFFSWQFVVLLMATIFIHESGHVWAMRKMGMKTKGFYFVPLLGGASVSDSAFSTRGTESYVAIMGPIWGGLMTIPTLTIWYITGNPLWAGITGWVAMVNLFNLLPVLPLDGGRILRSIAFSLSRKTGFILTGAGILLGAYISSKIGLGLFAFLLLFGGAEILYEAKYGRKARKFNEKLLTIEKIFPELNQNEIISILDLSYKVGCKIGDQNRMLFAALPWGDIDRICDALTLQICPNREFVCEHSRGLCSHDMMDERELVIHKHRITDHILDWISENYDKKTYGLFQSPMTNWKIAYSLVSYCAVAGLLYYTMYLTQHSPGSQAAFAIFTN